MKLYMKVDADWWDSHLLGLGLKCESVNWIRMRVSEGDEWHVPQTNLTEEAELAEIEMDQL